MPKIACPTTLSTLPPEVLCATFRFAVGGFANFAELMALASVSERFHTIIHNDPRLWSSLQISADACSLYDMNEIIEVVEDTMKVDGALPLKLCVDIQANYPIGMPALTKFLLARAERWEELTFRFAEDHSSAGFGHAREFWLNSFLTEALGNIQQVSCRPFTNLKKLVIDCNYGLLQPRSWPLSTVFPNVESLAVTFGATDNITQVIEWCTPSLKRMNLEVTGVILEVEPRATFLQELICRAPQLKSLDLTFRLPMCSTRDDAGEPFAKLPPHQSLESLTINGAIGLLSYLLGNLNCPSLASLSLTDETCTQQSNSVVLDIQRMTDRSRCAIKNLSFKGCRLESQMVADLLVGLPSLTNLRIGLEWNPNSDSDDPWFISELAEISDTSAEPVLPSLESLDVCVQSPLGCEAPPRRWLRVEDFYHLVDDCRRLSGGAYARLEKVLLRCNEGGGSPYTIYSRNA
ncbi:hypothetical protein CC1G_08184 [Coprinopsis cinerea okayama7|uniref:F-box domain-containing protein n=1 Tax=Coprinopsis cinerea (strain Okayama-7 / 130 / ATCC MYA-4618 / FGSC 9003) TaxID=240176 RepID=A8P798_COPC7|nr:hypothetical protein CC1G_08184 [Coprinopsis cinerea okayama7\|eukprot:XP_001839317.1 hypothetical protein CC1G_08184 [Coprinopsis cinerea okayama7\